MRLLKVKHFNGRKGSSVPGVPYPLYHIMPDEYDTLPVSQDTAEHVRASPVVSISGFLLWFVSWF